MPVFGKLNLNGLAPWLEALARAGADVDAAADEMLAAGGSVLARGMQERAPYLTGDLHDHLTCSAPQSDGNYHFIYVGLLKGTPADTVRKGAAQEYGTSSMPAHPYIRPTMSEDARAARARMVEVAKARGKL